MEASDRYALLTAMRPSERALSRHDMHLLLQAWKLIGYTPSPIKRTSLSQEMFLFLFPMQSQRSQDTVIIIGRDLRV